MSSLGDGRVYIAQKTAMLVGIIKKSGMSYEEYIKRKVEPDLKNFIFNRAEMDFIMTFYILREGITNERTDHMGISQGQAARKV